MSPRRINPVVRTTETAQTKPVTSAETVVATVEGISPDSNTPTVLLEGSCSYLNGATATTVVVRIRRGTTTAGAVVGKAQTSQIGASLAIGLSIQELDSFSSEQAGLSYCMTTEAPSATTNPEVNGATLTVTY